MSDCYLYLLWVVCWCLNIVLLSYLQKKTTLATVILGLVMAPLLSFLLVCVWLILITEKIVFWDKK